MKRKEITLVCYELVSKQWQSSTLSGYFPGFCHSVHDLKSLLPCTSTNQHGLLWWENWFWEGAMLLKRYHYLAHYLEVKSDCHTKKNESWNRTDSLLWTYFLFQGNILKVSQSLEINLSRFKENIYKLKWHLSIAIKNFSQHCMWRIS